MAKHADVGRSLDVIQRLMSGGLDSELMFALANHQGAMMEAFEVARRSRRAEWRLVENYQIIPYLMHLAEMPHGSVAWVEVGDLLTAMRDRSICCSPGTTVYPEQYRESRVPVFRTYTGQFWVPHSFRTTNVRNTIKMRALDVYLFDDLNRLQLDWFFRQIPGHTHNPMQLYGRLANMRKVYIDRLAPLDSAEPRCWMIQLGANSRPESIWNDINSMESHFPGLSAEPRARIEGFDTYYLLKLRINSSHDFDKIARHLGDELTQLILEVQHDESKRGAYELSEIGPELLGFRHIVPHLKK